MAYTMEQMAALDVDALHADELAWKQRAEWTAALKDELWSYLVESTPILDKLSTKERQNNRNAKTAYDRIERGVLLTAPLTLAQFLAAPTFVSN